MQLGLFMMPLHPPAKDRTFGFEEDIEAVVLADELGFSEAWIEYHIKAPQYLPQDSMLYKRNINEIQQVVKSQQIYHEWNLENFSLAPEDELHIQVLCHGKISQQ